MAKKSLEEYLLKIGAQKEAIGAQKEAMVAKKSLKIVCNIYFAGFGIRIRSDSKLAVLI